MTTAIVNVFLKEGVLDPQGKAAHHALDSLGFKGVSDVRIGKQIVLQLDVEKEKAEGKSKRCVKHCLPIRSLKIIR